ncbi:hypothetical protein, partial [Nostoc sp.]
FKEGKKFSKSPNLSGDLGGSYDVLHSVLLFAALAAKVVGTTFLHHRLCSWIVVAWFSKIS